WAGHTFLPLPRTPLRLTGDGGILSLAFLPANSLRKVGSRTRELRRHTLRILLFFSLTGGCWVRYEPVACGSSGPAGQATKAARDGADEGHLQTIYQGVRKEGRAGLLAESADERRAGKHEQLEDDTGQDRSEGGPKERPGKSSSDRPDQEADA